LIRVPTEVVKQRQQTSAYGASTSSFKAVQRVVQEAGAKGLYRGYFTTLAREIPFCCIQFPLYERFKLWAAGRRNPLARNSKALPPWPDAALCGSAAGAIASALTTPLDVAKTRIMLTRETAAEGGYFGTWRTLTRVYSEEGASALFKGVGPRVLWIGLGGAVFLGVYEAALAQLAGRPVLSEGSELP
jgi:solute carrier family 25 S-adenosylmethionine transporter 26